jgi:hypothetical protein
LEYVHQGNLPVHEEALLPPDWERKISLKIIITKKIKTFYFPMAI